MAEIPKGFKIAEPKVPAGFKTLAQEIGPQFRQGVDPISGTASAVGRGATFGLSPFLEAGVAAMQETGVLPSAIETQIQQTGTLSPTGGTFEEDFLTNLEGADAFSEEFKQQFGKELERERAELKAFREQFPTGSLAAEVGGGLLGPGGIIKGAKTLTGKAVAGAVEGAAFGAGFAAGEGEDIAEGAQIGAAFGLASPLFVRAIQKIPQGAALAFRGTNLISNSPTTQQLFNKAQALYRQAEEIGVVFPNFDNLINRVEKGAMSRGARRKLTPDVFVVVDELKQLRGQPVGFSDLDGIRQVASIAAQSQRPKEAAIGSKIIEEIDLFVRQGSGLTGEVAEQARSLWGRGRRDQLIAETIERARLNPAGTTKGIEVEFRNLSKNKKKLRGFSAEERRAIEEIAKGGPAQNTLTNIGKLGFSPNVSVGNVLGGSIGGTASAVGGGLPGFIAQQGVSAASRGGARLLQQRKLDLLQAMIRSGKSQGEISRIGKTLEDIGDNEELFNQLARSVTIGGATQN